MCENIELTDERRIAIYVAGRIRAGGFLSRDKSVLLRLEPELHGNL